MNIPNYERNDKLIQIITIVKCKMVKYYHHPLFEKMPATSIEIDEGLLDSNYTSKQ
jgi:hypothetical protein